MELRELITDRLISVIGSTVGVNDCSGMLITWERTNVTGGFFWPGLQNNEINLQQRLGLLGRPTLDQANNQTRFRRGEVSNQYQPKVQLVAILDRVNKGFFLYNLPADCSK